MGENEQRKELAKLRQESLNEEETPEIKKTLEKPKLKGKEWFKNFIYYHKIGIVVCAILAVLAGAFIYQVVTIVPDDVHIMLISTDEQSDSLFYYTQPYFEEAVKKFAVDTDENGKIGVRTEGLSLNPNANSQTTSVNAFLMRTNYEDGVSHIIIGNKEAFKVMQGDLYNFEFENLSYLYPNEEIEAYILYPIKGTDFEKAIIKEGNLPDDLYVAIRSKASAEATFKDNIIKKNDSAFKTLYNIIKNNVINEAEK